MIIVLLVVKWQLNESYNILEIQQAKQTRNPQNRPFYWDNWPFFDNFEPNKDPPPRRKKPRKLS